MGLTRLSSEVMKSLLIVTILYLLNLPQLLAQNNQLRGWKAGVAKVVITPQQPLWMAGYAMRNKPSEGIIHDLKAKAIYLEDSCGEKALLVTADILGFSKVVSDRIRDTLKSKMGLSKAQILLNSSHTHSGPVLSEALTTIYPMNSDQLKNVEHYTEWLIKQIVNLAIEAKLNIEPVKLYSKNGVVRFQVNRRNNQESSLLKLSELKGPNDFAVPVIKIADAKGVIKAIVFGYACHPTVLNGYQWSGDYPGFAQIELEKIYPGTLALFMQGAGADQNPMPRKTLSLAMQYGKELAVAVERVINENMDELEPKLATCYTEIDLPFQKLYSIKQLEKTTKSTVFYENKWAYQMLDKINKKESISTLYPYPLQAWRLGNQLLISLGGEVLIDYSIQFKRIFGESVFVLGYSNDVMGYIPSELVLHEGGYEGYSSFMVYDLPAPWKSGIEKRIIDGMILLERNLVFNSSNTSK